MGLITTNEARCRDCYRCLRGCAVKAIRFSAGDESGVLYARVIDELCVQDAHCVLFFGPCVAKKGEAGIEGVNDGGVRKPPVLHRQPEQPAERGKDSQEHRRKADQRVLFFSH